MQLGSLDSEMVMEGDDDVVDRISEEDEPVGDGGCKTDLVYC